MYFTSVNTMGSQHEQHFMDLYVKEGLNMTCIQVEIRCLCSKTIKIDVPDLPMLYFILTQPFNILRFSHNHSIFYISHTIIQYSKILTKPFNILKFSQHHSTFYSSHKTVQYSAVLTQPLNILQFSHNHSIFYSSHKTIQYSKILTQPFNILQF